MHRPNGFSALKDSMDAALTSVTLSSADISMAQPAEDEKQAQLRAKYLVGFRAAAEAQKQQSTLRENFENARHQQ